MSDPQPPPLEKRAIGVTTLGKVEEVPGVSPRWVTNLGFIPFFPEDNEGSGEVIEFLAEDTAEVLALAYHCFWSQVVHDASFMKFFDTYLRYARREFDFWARTGDNILEEIKRNELQKELFHNVFRIVLRMGRDKESSDNFMSPEYYAKLIYDNFVFDIPKIFDISVLYASYNTQAVSDLVHFLFNVCSHLARSAASTVKVLSEIRKRIYKNPKKMDLEEISSYLIDILCSLNAFLHIYPEACLVFGREGLLNAIALTYDVILPKFPDAKVQQKLRRPFLSLGRRVIDYYLTIIEGNDVAHEQLETARTDADLEDVANEFYETMKGLAGISGTLSESTEGPYSPNLFGKYINDMDKASGISKKLEELRDADIKCLQDINFEKIVSDFYGICGKLQQNKPSTTTTSSDNIDLDSPEILRKLKNLEEIFQPQGMTAGFLALCLNYWNGNEEEATHHILDNSLPAILEKTDKKLSLQQAKMVLGVAKKEKRDYSTSYTSVFDNTEADITSSKSRAQASYVDRSKSADMTEFDDKTHIQLNKAKYTDEIFSDSSESDLEEEWSKGTAKGQRFLYDDEPDDSVNQFEVIKVVDGETLDEEEEEKGEGDEDENGEETAEDQMSSTKQFLQTNYRGGRGAGGRGVGRGQPSTPHTQLVGAGRGQPKQQTQGGQQKQQQKQQAHQKQQKPQEQREAEPAEQQGRGRRGGGRGGRGGGEGGRGRGDSHSGEGDGGEAQTQAGGRGRGASFDAKKNKQKQHHNRKNQSMKKEVKF